MAFVTSGAAGPAFAGHALDAPGHDAALHRLAPVLGGVLLVVTIAGRGLRTAG